MDRPEDLEMHPVLNMRFPSKIVVQNVYFAAMNENILPIHFLPSRKATPMPSTGGRMHAFSAA